MLQPHSRIKITNFVDEPNPIGSVHIEEFNDKPITEENLDLEQQVIFKHVTQLFQEISRFLLSPDAWNYASLILRTANINDFIRQVLGIYEYISKGPNTSFVSAKSTDLIQDIFAETDLTKRLEKLATALIGMRKRIEVVMKIENRAAAEIEQNKEAQDEKSKAGGPNMDIKEGIKNLEDERITDVKRFRKNLEGKKVPSLVLKRFDEEVNRYLSMNQQHTESSFIRTYLDYLSSLPWGQTTEDRFDMKAAKKILDEGHYGMDDIKQRILEFLAVGKLQNKVQGKILCFVGPPGVGKTSIGESIAKYFLCKIIKNIGLLDVNFSESQ